MEISAPESLREIASKTGMVYGFEAALDLIGSRLGRVESDVID